jgi:hypothetical protein
MESPRFSGSMQDQPWGKETTVSVRPGAFWFVSRQGEPSRHCRYLGLPRQIALVVNIEGTDSGAHA